MSRTLRPGVGAALGEPIPMNEPMRVGRTPRHTNGALAESEGRDGDDRAARWQRLAKDFARLPLVDDQVRDVGALLLDGHDQALAEAERYVVEGHTIRTGDIIEWDDIDDRATLGRWAEALESASRAGLAPPAPVGFWASFLTWRTPLGMARLTERRLRTRS